MLAAFCEDRNDIAFDCLAVNRQGLDALGDMIRILDGDVIGCAAELSGCGEAVPCLRIYGASTISISITGKGGLGTLATAGHRA